MAVKRYNGSSWDVVAGVGAQGAAATSSTITTWVKTAAGGETSLSGNDDNSQSLSYTVGQELVFINGTLLKRGSDYTATNGTSITGLTALAANDVATVWTVNAFSVTGAIANTIVDAKGDLLVGTAADTPGRLAVGTDGQVLTAASTTGTGLTWATPASGSYTQLDTGTLSGASVAITSISDSYRDLVLVLRDFHSTGTNYNYGIRCNNDSTNANYKGSWIREDNTTPSVGSFGSNSYLQGALGQFMLNTNHDQIAVWIFRDYANTTSYKTASFNTYFKDSGSEDNTGFGSGVYKSTSAINRLDIVADLQNWSGGTYVLYGVK